MVVLREFLDWLGRLQPGALYAIAGAFAAAENVVPPLPSDVVVAFAAFVAARGRGSALLAFAAALIGNVTGAMLMYWVGHRYGAAIALKRLGAGATQEAKLRAWYARYGLVAIAASRLVPGVRAVVPPVAGALGVGVVRSAAAVAIPSAVWYGAITYIAFTAGNDFDALVARIGAGQRWVGIAAAALALAGVIFWLVRRRRSAA